MWGAATWPVTLQHGPVGLRPIRRSDKALWLDVRRRNHEWLQPWEPTQPNPGHGLPSFAQMVRSLQEQARAGLCMPFVIVAPDDAGQTRLVGQLTISNIMWGSACMATAGYWVDSAVAGRGYVPLALAMATDYCFFQLGLHRMELNIRPENAASLRVAAKLGFHEEGLKPRYLHIDGRWTDHVGFALTREDVPEGAVNRLTRGIG